jgi:branched-chain amino acid transport system permease protein
VSDALTPTRPTGSGASVEVLPGRRTRRGPGGGTVVKGLLLAVLAVVLLIMPLYVDEFWLRTGFACCAAIIGAIGLNLLVGTTGQLSLAHAFFLAVGAVTYVYVSGSPGGTATKISGLELPPLVGMVLGVLVAGLAGLLFSPIAARLRGIYLGVASLGLVFIGQHLLNTVTPVTGGFNGRTVPKFSLFGFSFSDSNPDLFVANVPFGESERLWYLGLALALLAYLFARNLLRSRAGRALQTLRDSEVAAAVMGVNVQGYKARVFLVSSMYAGLAGVLYGLSIGSVAPESFALDLSVLYLAMIVLGGLGSVGGAVLGAVFVSALPLVFQQYAGSLPFVSEPGQGGVNAGQAARLLFGLAIVLVVLFEPAGLAGFARRFTRRPGRPAPTARTAANSNATSRSTSNAPAPSSPPGQGSPA